MIKYILFTITLVLSSGLHGQEAMTLPKAISMALENNYGIVIADKFIEIAENNDTWARAGAAPAVDLTGTFNNLMTKDNNPASFLQGSFYNGSLGASLGANWILYAGGRVKIVKDQLELATTRERLDKEVNIHSLVRDIYQQYYTVIFQQERLEVLRSSYELSKGRLVYEQLKREYGTSNSFSIVQFENALVVDSINVITQDQQVEIAKRNLYNTLDVVGAPNYQYLERLSVTDEELDGESLKAIMSEDNYTLKSLQMVSDLNVLNTKLARAARKPSVSLNGSVGFSENAFKFFADDPMTGQPFDLLFSNRLQGSVGLQASWNLYDGGVRSGDVQNATIQQDIDLLSIEEAKANLTSQLDLLISNYDNQRELLKLSDDQIQVSQRNLEMTEERFKGGQVTSLDFRNVQLQYLNAAFAKVNAIYNMILTKIEIDFLVGKFE